jgi:hypothetical protein
MGSNTEQTSVLLASLPAERLNQLAEDGAFEAPVSGDDIAFLRADLAGRVL